MTSIKLSICIPTYNRAPHLRRCFEWLQADCRFDFPFEIIVADNASTDDTKDVVQEAIDRGMPVRYCRAYQNTGMIPNMVGAFHLGRGDYLVYLADDDRLVGDRIAEIVKYLDERPALNVCYAPMYIYDDATDTNLRKFFEVDEEIKAFPQGAFSEVFNFIYNSHAFPEMGVYRNTALRSCWVPREGAFYAFSILAHFVDQGQIVIMREPFYRQVIQSTIGRDRPQGGHDLAESAWDLYRGGLEYFLHLGTKRGKISALPDQKVIQEQMCRAFTLQRMAVAMRLLMQRREYLKVYEIYTRMVYGGFADHPQVKDLQQMLPVAAALQTLAYQLNFAAGVQRLVLSGFPDPSVIKDRLGQVRLNSHIEVITTEPTYLSAEDLDHTAVLVSIPAQRQRFVDLGYLPNLVFSQQDLVQTIVM